jgi:hypothetical protein
LDSKNQKLGQDCQSSVPNMLQIQGTSLTTTHGWAAINTSTTFQAISHNRRGLRWTNFTKIGTTQKQNDNKELHCHICLLRYKGSSHWSGYQPNHWSISCCPATIHSTSRETTNIVLRQWYQFSRSCKWATWGSQNASIHIPDVKNTGLLGHWMMHLELHSTTSTSLRRTLGGSRKIHEIPFEKNIGFSCCHLRRIIHIANRDRGLSKLQNPVRPIWWFF